jgi:hypothetical protein
MRRTPGVCLLSLLPAILAAQALNIPWSGYAHDPQHTAISASVSQPLVSVHWQTPVDLHPPGDIGIGALFIHYGSPLVTAANTVLVPVKTGSADGFEIQAFQVSGTLPPGTPPTPLYTLTSDYVSPAHNWIPHYSPTMGLRNRVYYPGAGGTVYYRDSPDSATGATGQIAFYGNVLYSANSSAFNSTVQIATPITEDRYGTIYFGFIATGPNAASLTSGIAKITVTGAGSWVPISGIGIGDGGITQPALNAGPVLSVDQRTLYVAVSNGVEFGYGYLVALNTANLAAGNHTGLFDPHGGRATVSSDSSASPMVGPDGDVYFGVLEANCCSSHNDRGWMLHFDSTLTQPKIIGSFGWDTTAAVVTSTLVPQYHGTSSYLILAKYNNYVGSETGSPIGDGVNKVAVLDPNAPMQDEYSTIPTTVMNEVITITGVTPDPHAGFPNAVREWCINTAAIDPFTKSALINSEDGWLYRWDFATNSFTQKVMLTTGLGEAYTPTAIGPDGTVYAINDAILFAVGR